MDNRIIILREKIDKIDEKLFSLIKERLVITREMGIIKQENKISIEDIDREMEIIDRLLLNSNDTLSDTELKRVFSIIFKFSKIMQK
jgi:chorismate mutase